jgi:predicted PurR-regulated permease PerM
VNFGKWFGFIIIVISLYVLWEIRQLLLLIFTAIILANALTLLVNQVQSLGEKIVIRIGLKPIAGHIGRGYSIALSFGLVVLAISIFFSLLAPPFVTQFEQLTELFPKAINQLIDLLEGFRDNLSPDTQLLLPDIKDIGAQLTAKTTDLAQTLIDQGWFVLSNGVGVLLNMLLLLVLTIMFLADPQTYKKGFIRFFPSFYRRRVDEILSLCDEALKGWLIGILFNMLFIALLSFIGLLVLNISFPLALAVFAGLLTFIPNVGPALSVIPPMVITLQDAPWKALAVLILYIIIQQVESNFLTPYVMAQRVNLPPAITLLSQIFFATFFGFLGLFLALPLTVVAQVWIQQLLLKDILDRWDEALPRTFPVQANLLSSSPPPEIKGSSFTVPQQPSDQRDR